MGFASVNSLRHTLEHILKSCEIFLVPPSSEIIEIAHKQYKSIEDNLKRLDSSKSSSKGNKRKRVDALEGRIGDAARNFEVAVGSHVADQIVKQSGSETRPLFFSIDLQDLKQDVDTFVETMKKMEMEYVKELDHQLPKEKQHGSVSSSSKMVGISDEYRKLKEQLTSAEPRASAAGVQVHSLVGMAGIGKTAFTKEIFEDEDVRKCFDCHAWVSVGMNCRLKTVRKDILAKVNYNSEVLVEEDGELSRQLYQSLKNRRYLIVLDDVWDTHVWEDLERLFPENDRGNCVLLTSRLHKVALHASKSTERITQVSLLDEEESWTLLCSEVFDDKPCPRALEKSGKKIAENCDGLPLTIVTVAKLLSKHEPAVDYWNKVAANRQHSLFEEAYDAISEVLNPSYQNLPRYLQVCFLYMGVFPQGYEIPPSKLIMLVSTEGFLEPNKLQTSRQDYMVNCLIELRFNNVVMLHQKNPIWYLISTAGIKTCRLHSSFWHMCRREARKDKFFYLLSRYADDLANSIDGEIRLCIHNNILFGLKNVNKSIEQNCASTACSLLCFGLYHPYPVPLCFGLGWLKILDALTVRFHEFPRQVLQLIQLKYLALTCNKKLPDDISKLLNLQVLIVRRHLSIKLYCDPSYLPEQIWDMKELKHLQIEGSDLPDHCGTPLINLTTLLDVTARSCTKGILEKIPHLKKLGVRIEVAPDAAEPLNCFDHIALLEELESLKCVVVNPDFGHGFVPQRGPLPTFPPSLKRLSLSGFGYPWERMSEIASLPNLEVLKLQKNAFRGANWEIEEKWFCRLKILVIEETDLAQWKVGRGSFKWLTCLSIKHCYNLVELDFEFGIFLSMIELIDCNPLVVNYVKQIRDAEERKGYIVPDVYVHASWNDGLLKTQGTTLCQREDSPSVHIQTLYNKHDIYRKATAGLEYA